MQATQATQATQRRLWELARDASTYLRKHASPAVRVAAALLLAASLAACNASASDTTALDTQTVAPLTQEVAVGLPRGPGSYEVVPGSVLRDQRGVYQFEWLDPGVATTPGHVAHASRLRLVRDERLALEIPGGTASTGGAGASAADGQGNDPILHLPANEDIKLIQEAQVGSAQPGYYPPAYGFWNPFLMGMLLGGRPAYYDPPPVVVVQSPPGSLTTGGSTSTIPRVGGGSASETVKPPAQRVTGVQSAVSGRAGGTGTGSAVTNRNLASGASSAARSGSSSVSSGSSASSAAQPSAGVSAPRSGGFSSGVGSVGGSSAS